MKLWGWWREAMCHRCGHPQNVHLSDRGHCANHISAFAEQGDDWDGCHRFVGAG